MKPTEGNAEIGERQRPANTVEFLDLAMPEPVIPPDFSLHDPILL